MTMARKKANQRRRRPAQKRKCCFQCKNSELEELYIIPKCKHIFCVDCLDKVEEEVIDDDEGVRSWVGMFGFTILTAVPF